MVVLLSGDEPLGMPTCTVLQSLVYTTALYRSVAGVGIAIMRWDVIIIV